MAMTLLESGAEIPDWVVPPGFDLVRCPGGDFEVAAPRWVGSRWAWVSDQRPMLNPEAYVGQKVALLYESAVYVGPLDNVRGGVARVGRIRSKWWMRASENVGDGWYDDDSVRMEPQPLVNGYALEGEEVIVMDATAVPGLTGMRTRARSASAGGTLVVDSLGIPNDRGVQSPDSWMAGVWVKMPRSAASALSVKQRETRIADLLHHAKDVAGPPTGNYCDGFEAVLIRDAGLSASEASREQEQEYTAKVDLLLRLDTSDLQDALEREYSGEYTVSDGIEIVAEVQVDFRWNGEEGEKRDAIVEALDSADYPSEHLHFIRSVEVADR